MNSSCTAVRALLLLGALVQSAAGQNQPGRPVSIPPVAVVATRFPEAPHDVAASIEVISGADLQARGVRTLREALALATGVAIAPGGDQGPASAVPEFWGLREFDAFLLVVDGVPWGGAFNPAIATLSLRDVERIEVLRGPAPVTYGATSFVGVVHVVHTAAAATARYAEAHGGSFGTGGAAVDLPIALSSGWSSRLSTDVERGKFSDRYAAYTRGHGLWRVGRMDGPRQMWLTADLNVLRQDPASPHPRQGASLSTAVPLDANHNPSGARLNDNRLAISAGFERPVLTRATWGTTASYTFSAQDIFRGFLTNVSNTPDNASGFKESIDVHDVYADSHLIWAGPSETKFMVGADALLAAGEGKGATFTYTAPLDGTTRAAVPEPSTLNKDAEDERRFLGAYGSAEWRPTARLTLNGGLRLNATSERRGASGEVTHTRLSGGVGALVGVWERGSDHLRLFANYRNTFKPAAFDFGLEESGAPEVVLEPETSQSHEGGLKARVWDGRLDFEASAFDMDFTNLVTATVVNGLPALVNSGKTRFKGFEFATDVRLRDDVWGRASYSFHDGTFVDFVQTFNGVPTQLGGKRFEMSARRLASVGVTLAPERGFVASVSANYTGDRYLNKRNTALVPAFTTMDVGVGYRLPGAELRLDGRNLSDRRDAVSESEFGDAQYYRMTARTILVGISMRY